MNTDFIKGVIVPILTPINENEFIDEAKLRDQVNYVIDGGVLGILAFGSNGEFYVIEEDEMERGLKIMIDQADGSPCTLESVRSALRNAAGLRKWLLPAALPVSPYSSPCS